MIGEGNGNPLQYACLENPVDGGACQAAVHGVAKSPDTTERLYFHFSLSCVGEGTGNPLQCSCLENPRDRGAWWAAIYGVAQSQTQLKRLSSSSRSMIKQLSRFHNSLFSLLNELVLIFEFSIFTTELILIFETKGGIIDSNILVWIYIFIWLYLPVSIEVCIIKWDTDSFCFFSITQICYQNFSIYMYTVITGCWIWLFILSLSLLSVWSLFSKAPQGLLGPWHLVHCQ